MYEIAEKKNCNETSLGYVVIIFFIVGSILIGGPGPPGYAYVLR